MQIIHWHPGFYRASQAVAQLSADAKQRWRQLNLYQQLRREGCCEATALEAVGLTRSTYYRWLACVNQFGPRGLEFKSRRPRQVRQRQWDRKTRQTVLRIRRRHPLWGRAKIRRVLQREHGIELSESTVGRMLNDFIERNKILPAALYQGRTRPKRPRSFNRHARRWKKASKAQQPGQMVQIDHMSVSVANGFMIKEFKAVCPHTRLCFMRAYSSATAVCATRFLDYLIQQAPFQIESIQVDGGSEFMADFERACEQRGILLYVLPPKSPQLNGCVERANGASRYEFYPFYLGDLNVGALNVELKQYQHHYNTYRPHQALGQQTPMEHYKMHHQSTALAA